MATVLITGASSGIGKDLAYLFAAKKSNLILVARNKEALQNISADVEKQYGVSASFIALDLSLPDGAQKLYNEVKKSNSVVDVLVNNAGIGLSGEAVEMDVNKVNEMITLNMNALTELSLLFGHNMKAARSGHILNIASTAAFQPAPYLGVYAATKAYVLHFSEALYIELKQYGVGVTAVCPGPTHTNWAKGANMQNSAMFAAGVMKSNTVAQKAYEAMMKNKMTSVVGRLNQLMAASVRFLPRHWIAAISGRMMK